MEVREVNNVSRYCSTSGEWDGHQGTSTIGPVSKRFRAE